MSLLAAYDLNLGFHGKILFRGESMALERRERLGLVGPNGSGKSTLLRILVGETQPDSGTVVRARGLRVGYLTQELVDAGDELLLDAVLAAAPRRASLEERLVDVQADLETATEPEHQLDLATTLADLHAELADLDRHFAPHHARRILLGLGFSSADFQRPLVEFSGGWRMRAALAALLYRQPEVMLLDEPTNHLDMPTVNWLNRFLDGFPHALVLVCHDREFMNRHVSRVLAFEPEGLRSYQGNYDDYVRQRELELGTLENRARRDEQRRKDLETFIARNKAKKAKARQAQSKARLIEKMIEQQVDVPKVRRSIAVRFSAPPRSGDPVLEIAGLGHAYGSHRVLAGIDLTVRRGDRIAVVGLNGAGKTTLLKLIAGELPLQDGEIRAGGGVEVSYFAQHHTEALSPARSVLDEVWRAAPGLTQSFVRGVCGAFLFSGDDVTKKVGVLSGGEKTRVALARLLVHPGNLLLLDEPTNHLDTTSADKLTDSLLTFAGTIIFVSHNVDFARRLSTKVWDVQDGTVSEYPGSLADYLNRWTAIQDEVDAREGGDAPAAPNRPGDALPTGKEARIRAREELVQRRKERVRLERRVSTVETEVAALEQEKDRIEAALCDPAVYADQERAAELAERFASLEADLAARLADWEELSALLEGMPDD